MPCREQLRRQAAQPSHRSTHLLSGRGVRASLIPLTRNAPERAAFVGCAARSSNTQWTSMVPPKRVKTRSGIAFQSKSQPIQFIS
jgi:hypothetical protein